jgi:hypothetical protein
MNRWSGLMLVVGLLAGYTVAGSSAQAQTESLTEIRGDFVKCDPRSRAAGGDRSERWVTLKYVVQITKNES